MHDAVRVFPRRGGKPTAHAAEGSTDARIAELAARQHGTVARRQLIARGLSSKEIERRIACGRLHPLHRGVYAVGHKARSGLGRWIAAVLAAGAGAVISHRSAGALWAIAPSSRPRTEITVPGHRRAPAGVEVRQSRLAPDERAVCDGIPVTTVARTLLAPAQPADPGHALRRRGPLRRLPARARPSAGAANLWVDGHEVDCCWADRRVIVELDGHAFHHHPAAFHRDRARQRRLTARGWRVVSVAWRDLTHEPGGLHAELAEVLA